MVDGTLYPVRRLNEIDQVQVFTNLRGIIARHGPAIVGEFGVVHRRATDDSDCLTRMNRRAGVHAATLDARQANLHTRIVPACLAPALPSHIAHAALPS